jgi:hypothetical protein
LQKQSENKEIKMQMQMRIEFSNWLYEFYCGAEIREGEGGVSERRSRAEATVSSMGDGDGAIVSLSESLSLSFCFSKVAGYSYIFESIRSVTFRGEGLA